MSNLNIVFFPKLNVIENDIIIHKNRHELIVLISLNYDLTSFLVSNDLMFIWSKCS